MDKKPLIVISLCAVVLLVLGSLCNVVGYQTVQSSNQSVINERINQRELLFQTICDIANNKEIQRIILKSQLSRGILPPSEFPVVTKNQIRQMNFLGLILSKGISTSRMHSMIQKYQLLNPITKEEMNGVIEKDVTLKGEITQLQDSVCDCVNESASEWRFPVICVALYIIFMFFIYIMMFFQDYCNGGDIAAAIANSIAQIADDLNCFWGLFDPDIRSLSI